MQPSRIEQFRNKVKLTLTLPETKLKTKQIQELPYNQPSTKSETSLKSNSSSDTLKASFLQKYTIDQPLGQGAHGVVKACTLKQKNIKYAVKIMKLNEEISLMYRKNFRTMKCLNHPNILKYRSLYLDKTSKTSYLVMEYLPYPTLKALKLSHENQLVIIAEEILTALIYVHKKNVSHRDLKPANILYSREERKIKLIDFGICKKMTMRGEKSQMLTATGTIAYKAPQIFDCGGYDQKIDMWALGVILYELVTGKNPFYSSYTEETIKNITSLDVTFPEQAWSQYDKLLKDLVSRLLKRKTSERLSAVQALNHLYFQKDILLIQNSSYRYKEKIEDVLIHREYGTICEPKQNKVLESKLEFTPTFYDSEEEQGIF